MSGTLLIRTLCNGTQGKFPQSYQRVTSTIKKSHNRHPHDRDQDLVKENLPGSFGSTLSHLAGRRFH